MKRQLVLFSCSCLHQLQGDQKLEEETSKSFNVFMRRMDGLSPSHFHGVHINDSSIVEDLLLLNIRLFQIDIVERYVNSEIARRSVQKHENTVQSKNTIFIHAL